MLFVIGLMVGMVLGGIITGVISIRYALKHCNMSYAELTEAIDVMAAAGNNRESTLVAYHDDVAVLHADFHE